MNSSELRALVDAARLIEGILVPLEPLVAGLAEALASAFASHVTRTLPEIEAAWIINEAQSAALMKPAVEP